MNYIRCLAFVIFAIAGTGFLTLFSAQKQFHLPFDKKGKNSNKEISTSNPGLHPESALAHQLLDGLKGIEIGASAHNPFGLDTLNVDYTDDYATGFKQVEIDACGTFAKVDVISPGDQLAFADNTWDFVISSHVIEHFYDPIRTLKEWMRVTKPGGYVYIIVPHKERTFDKERPRTPLAEIVDRHLNPNPPEVDHHGHYSVWITQDFVDLCKYMGWNVVAVQDVDDKVGNGFTVVLKKH